MIMMIDSYSNTALHRWLREHRREGRRSEEYRRRCELDFESEQMACFVEFAAFVGRNRSWLGDLDLLLLLSTFKLQTPNSKLPTPPHLGNKQVAESTRPSAYDFSHWNFAISVQSTEVVPCRMSLCRTVGTSLGGQRGSQNPFVRPQH